MTLQQFKLKAVEQLENTSPTASLDVQVLLEFILKLSKTQILLNRDKELEPEVLCWLEEAIEKRKTGLPVAYITNQKEFYGYKFYVTPDVLIPKPDTEILVERAIDLVIEKTEANPNKILTICDMCSGSGCIGISVLKTLLREYDFTLENLPMVTFVDISQKALDVSMKNAKEILEIEQNPDLLSRLRFIRSNLFDQVPWHFDLILTNPPYIPHSLVDKLLTDGRNEPRLALDGDISITGDRAKNMDGSEKDDGLEIIRNMLPQMTEKLAPLGKILMETGEYNAEETAFQARKWGYTCRIHKDLEGQLRVVEMKL